MKLPWDVAAQAPPDAAPGAPVFEVHGYHFDGSTVLPVEQLSGSLSNFTGTVSLARIHAGLDRLAEIYQQSGITNVSVSLPPQQLTDGIVRVLILPLPASGPAPAADEPHKPAARPAPTISVRAYRIEGNTVLPPGNFGVLSNYTGTNLDFPRLREGLGKIQLRYHDLGFPTISVTLPPQKLTNGVVRVKIIEGKLSDVQVVGNRYFSTENIRRALPSLTTNILLNTKWLQPELDRANANQDRQIYPVIAPGLEPGTSELTLKVKDRLPLHEHIEINDKSTPGTPLLRVDAAIQYGNLWQHEHQIGFDYNFSPQGMKPVDQLPQFYDQPTVASYSSYYRLPLGPDRGLRQKYQDLPVDFGYDEVTHRFNLPPPTGRPELVAYASRSTTDTGTRLGPVTTLTDTATLNVSAQNAEHDPTVTANVGARLIFPLPQLAGMQSSINAGFDIKSYRIQTLSTNLTRVEQFDTNYFPPVLKYSATVPLAHNGGNGLLYLPLSLGWSGSRADARGSFSFNFNESLFLSSLASARKRFQAVAGSVQAGGNFTTISGGLVRQQNLPGDWSAVLNLNGQWSSAPLINNEQFGLGGTGGVRGYPEGESYGDAGWRALFDLRAPPVTIGYFPTADGDVPARLICSWFMDYGELYHLVTATGNTIRQWGTGIGVFYTAGEHLSARLTLAWALQDTPVTAAGTAQAYFSVGYQF